RSFFSEAANEFQAPGCYSIRSTSFLFLPVTLAAFAAAVRLVLLSLRICLLRLRGPLRGFVTNGIDGIQLRHQPGHCRSHAVRGGKVFAAPSPCLPISNRPAADRRAMAHSRDCAADRNFLLYVYADDEGIVFSGRYRFRLRALHALLPIGRSSGDQTSGAE